MNHAISGLSNPLTFAFMAVVGCTLGHALMAPLGLFEVSAKVGAFFTELTGNALNLSQAFGGAAATAADLSVGAAPAAAAPLCHLHGTEWVCH
jgi:hypothetical protein